ncbi:MAG: hypothetical protein HY898_29380 [Deltaproteobacteria bacterium]|nr:hypothetical protein [Deltaproteobacteria bacterium]
MDGQTAETRGARLPVLIPGDYELAVLHLAWNFRRGGIRTLLFGFVELLPTEVPPPFDEYDSKGGHRLGGDSECRVCIRHAVVPARDAVAWYEACQAGVMLLPRDPPGDGLPGASDATAKSLQVGPFDQDPVWPAMVCLDDSAQSAPFMPQWIDHPRAHHMIRRIAVKPDTIWGRSEEREAAGAFLDAALHFDWSVAPELWGSLHMIAPNPVFRSVDSRRRARHPESESTGDQISVRLSPRAGRSLEGLTLRAEDRRRWGLCEDRTVPLTSPIAELQFMGRIGHHRLMVTDKQRGVLLATGDLGIVGGFRTRMEVSSTRVVTSTDPADCYEVRVADNATYMHVGETSAGYRSAQSCLWAVLQRQTSREASRRIERWFSGDRVEARAAIRDLVNPARDEVLVVDPYFASTEIVDYMLAVGGARVPIRILTATEALKERRKLQGQPVEEGDALQRVLDDVSRQGVANPYMIRVMAGEKPEIHDRFLVIDGRVYLIGSSLNEFGSRGTMLIELTPGLGVEEQLEAAWDRATPFDEWLANRRGARRGPLKESTDGS